MNSVSPTGLLMIVLGVFIAARLVAKDSNGETLAGRLAGGQPPALGAASTSSSTTTKTGSSSSTQAAPGATASSSALSLIPPMKAGSPADTHSAAFATDVLKTLGTPTTKANISSLVDWIDREGNDPSIDLYNPLDTELPEPGSRATNDLGNGQGVQTYTGWAQGVLATAQTLAQSNFTAILGQLKSGLGINSANASVYQEIESWSGGGYGGGSGF